MCWLAFSLLPEPINTRRLLVMFFWNPSEKEGAEVLGQSQQGRQGDRAPKDKVWEDET